MKTNFFSNCLGVFQGGGCRAIAYVGAYRKSVELGIFFSELVGSSAGSIVATLIGAGANPDQLETMMRKMDFCKMKAEPEDIARGNKWSWKLLQGVLPNGRIKDLALVFNKLGLYSSKEIERWVSERLSEITGIQDRPILFRDLKIPTSVVSTDLSSSRLKIWSTHETPDEQVARAVRCSCTIPIYYQPVAGKYVDGGILSNLPVFLFKDRKESHFSRVLAYRLNASEHEKGIENIERYFSALAGAVVDGAQGLQISLQDMVYCVDIPTKDVLATDFDKMTDNTVADLIHNGELAVDQFVRDEYRHIKAYRPSNVCSTKSESLNLLSGTVGREVENVVVSNSDGKFTYELFLTMLYWHSKNTNIKVLLSRGDPKDVHAMFQLRLMHTLGFEVRLVENVPCNAFVVHSRDMEASLAIVDTEIDGEAQKVVYRGEADQFAIQAISNQIEIIWKEQGKENASLRQRSTVPRLTQVDEAVYIALMRKVSQYSSGNVQIVFRDVNISEIRFLTKYIRGYKYRQIDVLFDLYRNGGVDLFGPAKIQYSNGAETVVGVPVVEELHGVLYVIEGNTRFYHMFRNGDKLAKCLVVRNVTDPLPSDGCYKIDELLLTEGDHKGAERYEQFSYHRFRHIESAVRDPATSLAEV